MKTVEQWAQELPEDVREKFLANVMRVHGEYGLNRKYAKLSIAIIRIFTWDKSPEGFEYWDKTHDKLKSENR